MPSDDPDSRSAWLVRVDTGGTFTDGWARAPDGSERRCKVLSSGVLRTTVEQELADGSYRLASTFGAADGVLEGFALPDGVLVTGWEESARRIRFGRATDLATGALVELSSGEEAPVVAARLMTGTKPGSDFPSLAFRLATTRGTNALLERTGEEGVLFITKGFEDLLRIRDQRRPKLFARRQKLPPPVFERTVGVRERIAANGEVLEELDENLLERELAALRREGVRVAAVTLLNSYANPVHERRVGELLEKAGFELVSLSHELSGSVRLLPRAETAAANAYLGPVMHHFVNAVASLVGGDRLELMTSAGSLKPASRYLPIDSLLSGPAGGVMGALAAAARAGRDRVLAFDMGGTSTDVARLEGVPGYRYEQQIGPVRVLAPAVRIETVAAGGGSICSWRNAGLEVGPESAGANPGPACYGRGGPLTITDVNLLLGCMEEGKTGIPLDREAAEQRLQELKETMRRDGAEPGLDPQLLGGLREIAVERMADAIRKVSLREGYDPTEYTLVAFGGAGPQHACAVAGKLGVSEILVPGDAGLLSAWGLHRSAREQMAERQVLRVLSRHELLERALCELREEALAGLATGAVISRHLFELRLWGQDAAIEIEFASAPSASVLLDAFETRYASVYGYPVPEGREIELVAIRVVAAERLQALDDETFGEPAAPVTAREVRQDAFRTCVVESGWRIADGSCGSMMLCREDDAATDSAPWNSEVEAELFRCRFENVVEEMGELLRRTAISTNVKERLDFSCALLDARGRLVVNAPHIPVHLGALGLCVREVSKGVTWNPGDMVVVNHPGFGGSHLPDITVISPVFVDEVLVAFVANRAHHAELGGRTPGSMPATACSLEEEGVVIPPTFLFEAGASCVDRVEALFRAAKFPSRGLPDNLADLAAQAAANRHGVAAVERLVEQASRRAVVDNMQRLYDRAAFVMASKLAAQEGRSWSAEDAMDDGARICATIRREDDRLVIDFAGSGPVHGGNLNATPAIVRSAVLYALRLWVEEDLPLNEGLLEAVDLRIPPGILNPPFPSDPANCPAVVGGNTETSQRVVDVLLEALGLQAHSEGTMNNFLFGTEAFGYYETIGGGSGAGPGWDGISGTHVHMSNTAITDPEILERRFPVRVREFSLRRGSGGAGTWRGGDGLIREIEFLEAVTVSLLTQRREAAPRGVNGGGDGASGRQVLVRRDGSESLLPPITSFEVSPGDRLRLETPGGGGWG